MMKITYKNDVIPCFKNLKKGEVFLYENDPAMKLEEMYDSNDNCLNAINLRDGELFYIGDYKNCIPLNCELIVNP